MRRVFCFEGRDVTVEEGSFARGEKKRSSLLGEFHKQEEGFWGVLNLIMNDIL